MFKLEAPDNLSFAGLDLNKNLKIIVTGLSNFSIRIYSLELKQQLEKIDAYYKPLNSLKFSDDNCLVSLDASLSLKEWKLDLINKSLTYTKEIKKLNGEILNFGCS